MSNNYTKGELPCGCKAETTFNPENYTIVFCPMHKSAPKLYEALKELQESVLVNVVVENDIIRNRLQKSRLKASQALKNVEDK